MALFFIRYHSHNAEAIRVTLGAPRPQTCARVVTVRSLNRRKSCGHCLFRLNSPPMRFPPQAVIGGSSLDP